MSARGIYFTFAIVFMFALAIGDIVLVKRNGQSGLGGSTILGKVLTTVSIVCQSGFIAITGVELITRFYLSAFGYPCSFQRREICWFEYRMSTFWKALKIETAISFPITTSIAVLMFFLDIKIAHWKELNIPITTIMVGASLVQLILSCIGHYLAKQEFFEQYPEEKLLGRRRNDEESSMSISISTTPRMSANSTPRQSPPDSLRQSASTLRQSVLASFRMSSPYTLGQSAPYNPGHPSPDTPRHSAPATHRQSILATPKMVEARAGRNSISSIGKEHVAVGMPSA